MYAGRLAIYTYTHSNTHTHLPVVVKPGGIAGDDDVMGLLGNIVLSRVYQSVHLSLALLFIVLG